MKHLNPDCTNIELGSGNCPKCNKTSDEVWDEAVEKNRNIKEEAIRNLFRDYLKNCIREES